MERDILVEGGPTSPAIFLWYSVCNSTEVSAFYPWKYFLSSELVTSGLYVVLLVCSGQYVMSLVNEITAVSSSRYDLRGQVTDGKTQFLPSSSSF